MPCHFRHLTACLMTTKDALLEQTLAAQHTMIDLSKRIHAVDRENTALEEENDVLREYIENIVEKLGPSNNTAAQTRTNRDG